jgi:hypothetical protein
MTAFDALTLTRRSDPCKGFSGDIILIFIIWEFSLQALRTLLADLNRCYSRDKENLKKQVAGQSDFEDSTHPTPE